MLFKKKFTSSYDPSVMTPVLHCSICTGETVAGFRDNASGQFIDDALIVNESDLNAFKKKYGITGDIEKIY